MRIKTMIPKRIRDFLRPLFLSKDIVQNKHEVELGFWRNNYKDDNENFRNEWYKPTMLAMANEKDDDFIKDKVIADFGCGPRGSLQWADKARLKIGIDVLADVYLDEFKDCLLTHDMVYLKSTEHVIPLPTNFLDIMFSLNAIDHVDNFEEICNEIIRVLKPGAKFIGSFNLNEPDSITEPQSLTEEKIKDNLLNKMKVTSYRLSQRHNENPYQHFFNGTENYVDGELGFLWVNAIKH